MKLLKMSCMTTLQINKMWQFSRKAQKSDSPKRLEAITFYERLFSPVVQKHSA